MSSFVTAGTQVSESDLLAQNAQDTANEVAGNVNDINSDNKLTPSEKLKLKQEYDKDVELYNIDIEQLKSVDLPTAELETAMSNLTNFITPLFKEMNKTSTVDRNTLDSVFTAFATADKNASQTFVNMVQQVADDAKKAGDDAKEVGEKAQAAGEEAKVSANQAKADATQAKADAATAQQKAQSSIDQLNVHLPDIDKALNTTNLIKQDVTRLSNTTEQYHTEYTTGIQNVIKTMDDITVGGTNLVINSGYPTGTEHWIAGGGAKNVFRVAKHPFYHNGTDNTFNLINQGEHASLECYASSERFPVKPNTQYSLSFKGFASSNVPSMDVFFLGRRYSSTSSIGYDKAILIVDKKVLSTSHVDTVQAVFNTGDCEEGYLRFDNNGSLDGKDSSLYFTEIKVEEGTRVTDWSLSPFDTATSTEIDQLNNAIKLKADSSDVTSQITVATQGIQSEVNNKVTDLNTKISQTSDVVQILATTGGQKNLVYNSSYANNAEGWDMYNSGYLSTLAVSSYNGSPGFGVNVSGKDTSTWTAFGRSKLYSLPQPDAVAVENTYSASAILKIYSDSDSGAYLSATVTYFDKDGKRLAWKDMLVEYKSKDVWTNVKFEDFKVPKGAYSIGMQYWAHGSRVHGMIAQPMIVFGSKIGTYNPDTVGQSDITASINNINLKVSNSDGSSSQVNINNNTILLDANKIIINGNTSIQNGTIGTAKIANAAINTAQIADGAINNAKIANAAIDDAKISNLNGNKIVAGSITSKQLNANDIIANVINGKTINGITINTPTLDLGLNGTLTTDFNIDQDTSLYAPKKGTGTLTIKTGVINSRSQNMSRYSSTAAYWYGFDDNGNMVKNGTNPTGDDYAPGYEKHDIMKSNGNVLNRSYLDAMALALNEGGTQTFNTMLTAIGLETGNALLHKDLATEGTFEARLGTDNTYGFKIDTQVVSPMIRANSYTYAANVFISSYGTMGLATSTKANKLDIVDVPDMLQKGYNLLTINPRQWFDKTSVEAYADVQSGNSDSIESVVNIKPVTGMVAEEVASAGLDDYVVKDENNKVQGLAYDRLWTLLLPVLRDMNEKINKLQKKEGI